MAAAAAGSRALLLIVIAVSLASAGPVRAGVRISEVMYNPALGPDHEYIELHNDGPTAVNVGGWSFTDGLSYTIPAGRTIAAGGYLVVAKSRSLIQAAYPELDPAILVGDHAASLENEGERITLLDASRAVVESFLYDDDSPWDFLADGFGASLERLCLTADPALPENWRSSPVPATPEQAGGSPGAPSTAVLCPPEAPARPPVRLSEVMYHPVEENDIDDNHEFIEIHNPGAEPVPLAGWRLVGGTDFTFPAGASIASGAYLVVARNRDRLLRVTSYALNPASVLGNYTRTLDNGGEKVALVGPQGQGVDSMSYDDDFPWPEGADALGAGAEWLPPSLLPLTQHQYRGISLERVSFEVPAGLIYNWAPSPLDGATPGRSNASARPVPLPIVTDLNLVPVPGPGPLVRKTDQVRVRARFEPPSGLSGVVLEYYLENLAVTGEAIQSIPMSDDGSTGGDPTAGDGEYTALLPAAHPDNSLVRYRIKANRGPGPEVVSPRPTDPHGWHSWFVSPAVSTTSRLYQLLISPASWGTMWNNIQGGRVNGCEVRASWDAEVPAVFIHQGRVHDVFVRYQGSRYNRTNGPVLSSWPFPGPSAGPNPPRALSWRISFPRYAQHEGRSVIILNKLTQGCPGFDAGVGYKLFAAVGVPAPESRYVRFHINGGYYHYVMEYERPGEEMMRRWHRERRAEDPGLPEEKVGHLFKSAGCNCDEGPYGWGDERVLNPSCNWPRADPYDRYRYTYDRKTHGWGSYEDLALMIEDLNALRGDEVALREFFADRFDLELLLNYLAVMNWSVPFDDMFQNHFLYQRLSDGKWIVVPWDVDLNFGGWKGASASLYVGEQGDVDNRSGWWNVMKDAFFKSFRGEFESRLLELTNTVLHPDEVSRLVDEVMRQANPTEAQAGPAGLACSFTSDANVFKTFARDRLAVVNSRLAPQANAGPDQSVIAGTVVQFDATGSRPDPGPQATYSWSNGMTGERPTRLFDTPGVYTLTLTLTYNAQTYRDTVVITVLEPPPEAFQESGGQVVMEAEHFWRYDAHGAPQAFWAEASTASGFSGEGYMRAGDAGTVVIYNASYAQTSPELVYAILFQTPGLYRVWVRSLAATSGSDSVHVGLDGEARDESFAQRLSMDTQNFIWAGNTRGQGSQFVDVSTAGVHVLSLWIRESGVLVDKVLLTRNSSFMPTGGGPGESPVVPVGRGEAFVRGDANEDGALDLSDPVRLLFHLFSASGPDLACEDHGDSNDDGELGVADVLYLLAFLFRNGPAPSAPYPQAGYDSSADPFDCGNG